MKTGFSVPKIPKIQKFSGYMSEHVQTHVKNLEFDCDKCGKTLKSTSALRCHKRRDHDVMNRGRLTF